MLWMLSPHDEDSFNEINVSAQRLQLLEKLHPELFSNDFLKVNSVVARGGMALDNANDNSESD